MEILTVENDAVVLNFEEKTKYIPSCVKLEMSALDDH